MLIIKKGEGKEAAGSGQKETMLLYRRRNVIFL